MTVSALIISCPYCRRQYTMKLDREEIERDKRRATCGRCGNSFELASRIVVPGSAKLAPPPTARRTTGSHAIATPATASAPAPSAAKQEAADLDALTKEILAAADEMKVGTPVAPPQVVITIAKDEDSARTAELPVVNAADAVAADDADDDAPEMSIFSEPDAATVSELDAAPGPGLDATPPPELDAAPELAPEVSLEAEAGESEPTASAPLATTPVPAPMPTRSSLPWSEQADPGLAGLRSVPSLASIALERIL